MSNDDFRPAFDYPRTVEEAIEVIEQWGKPSVMTFSSSRAKVCAELLNAAVLPSPGVVGADAIDAHLSQPQPVAQGEGVAWQRLTDEFADELHEVFVDCEELSESAIRNALARAIEKHDAPFPVADFEMEGGVLSQRQRDELVTSAKATPTIPTGYRLVPVERMTLREYGIDELAEFAISATKWMETVYRDSDYKLMAPPSVESVSNIAKEEYEELYESYDDARKQIEDLKAESSRYRSALEEISDPLGFDWSTKPEIDCAAIARKALAEAPSNAAPTGGG